MWELDHKEGWEPKNWCFLTVVMEKTLENPLDSKIKPVNPKWNQSWIFTGRTDAEAEAPILWPPDVKCWLIGKDWFWERLRTGGEGVTEGGWHHWLNRHEFEQTLGNGEGQGSLACCSPWGHKELDMTWTSLVAQMVKRLPTMQETQVWSLGREDPLEKEMAPHSSILAWKIPWTEDPVRLQSMGLQRIGHNWVTSLLLHSLHLATEQKQRLLNELGVTGGF